MKKIVRPEISANGSYYISKFRYYELKYFCMQYKDYKKELNSLIKVPTSSITNNRITQKTDPVLSSVEEREYYKKRIDLILLAAGYTDVSLKSYILEGITSNVGYNYLKTVKDIPCGKDLYYKNYHKFFYILHNLLIKTDGTHK